MAPVASPPQPRPRPRSRRQDAPPSPRSTTSSPAGPVEPGSPDDVVTAYARDAVDGRILVGRLVRLACERHLRDLEHGYGRGLRFDVELALEAIEFFQIL